MNSEPIDNIIIVGITTETQQLRQRIRERTERFFESGVLGEAQQLAVQYGWDNEAMTGNIYPLARQYFADEISLSEMKQLFDTKEWHLAKRQLTWLKRNPHITWLPLPEAHTYLTQALAQLNKLWYHTCIITGNSTIHDWRIIWFKNTGKITAPIFD